VIGVDVNPAKVDMINRGLSPVVEERLDEAVASAVKARRLRAIPHFDRLLIADLRRALDGAGMIVIGHASREDIALLEAEHDGRPILDLQGVPALPRLSGVRYRSLC